MFRIHFDAATGRFKLQVIKFGLFWVDVKVDSFTVEDAAEPVSKESKTQLTFPTYNSAINHVNAIGLDTLYEDRSANKYRLHMDEKVSTIDRDSINAFVAWCDTQGVKK